MDDDVLTCGVCYQRFALAEILRFIEHKMHNCSNKENSSKKSFGLALNTLPQGVLSGLSALTNLSGLSAVSPQSPAPSTGSAGLEASDSRPSSPRGIKRIREDPTRPSSPRSARAKTSAALDSKAVLADTNSNASSNGKYSQNESKPTPSSLFEDLLSYVLCSIVVRSENVGSVHFLKKRSQTYRGVLPEWVMGAVKAVVLLHSSAVLLVL